jgi:hypothetical protein
VMNPPFANFQDIAHVRAAFNLLEPGGRSVAVMGEGVFFRQDRKAEDSTGRCSKSKAPRSRRCPRNVPGERHRRQCVARARRPPVGAIPRFGGGQNDAHRACLCFTFACLDGCLHSVGRFVIALRIARQHSPLP